ncbi:hypothetical protein ACIG87_15395 [Micromonospora sp. NPDC051925]|uniref:hypothetical protein n=1 Tax=Micromonospora sp. NPDC051925 TaxID=3364288 RepID=UPI0037C97C49
MKRATSLIGLATAVTLTALLASCAEDENPPTTLPTSAPPVSTSTSPSAAASAAAETPEEARQHAIDAYVGMQTAFEKASAAGEPSYPDLPKYATSAALTLLTNGLNANKRQGLLARGQTIFHPQVASLSPPAAPTRASVRDCMDTSKTERYKADGSPYKDSPGGMRLVLAEVERIEGAWKVTAVGIREVGSCKR